MVIYDSKFTGDLSSSLSHQLALLYRTWSEEDEGDAVLHVVVPNMQQQLGGNDCGLFTIEFAVHAKLGESVEMTKPKCEIISLKLMFHKGGNIATSHS